MTESPSLLSEEKLAAIVQGAGQVTHGREGTPEYQVWSGIKTRCYNPNDESFADYGARGIAMCDKWRVSFQEFLADMGERPTAAHRIERINNDKDYSPENCKWATAKEQARNRRSNRLITYKGETLCAAEWQDRTGIRECTIRYRLNNGWTPEEALTTSTRKQDTAFSLLPS